ncbi:MAG: hypothetical protein IIX47_00875, partial [Spirochaetaceae bacterium]|nr:hypothetical protein [Spirochaetaceae bacterium]
RDDQAFYANKNTVKDVKERFSYVFKKTQLGGGKPLLKLIPCENFTKENPLKVGNLSIIPVPMYHGKLKASGWIFKDEESKSSLAYLTDCSFITDESLSLVKNCTHIVIDALREKIHTTHFNFEQAMEFVSKTESKEIYFTHISHETTHERIIEIIDELKTKFNVKEKQILPAWDGLELSI